MAYKRNPMRSERATGLARFAISLVSSPLQTPAEQWFERTLDDSSNKRLSIPELFLAVDGCLNLVKNIAAGLVVYPKAVQASVNAELPFMATEEILMAAVRAGGDRQKVHEIIRRHSQAAGQRVKQEGCANDLLDRLAGEAEFSKINLKNLLDPRQFVGRAPEQVDQFVQQVVEPIRARYRDQLGRKTELKV
jgi:adenylosuccinate lyase